MVRHDDDDDRVLSKSTQVGGLSPGSVKFLILKCMRITRFARSPNSSRIMSHSSSVKFPFQVDSLHCINPNI